MKKTNQEYLTYYSPEYIYIPYDNLELLKLRKDKVVLNNMIIGTTSDNKNIFSPVSGLVIGTKVSNYLNGERNSLVIENDFVDRRIKLNPFKEISKITKNEINELLIKHNLYQRITSKTTLIVKSNFKKDDLGDMAINYEYYEEILEAIDEVMDVYNIKTCYIVIPKGDYISYTSFNKYINAFPNICIVENDKKIKGDKCVTYSIESLLGVYRAIHLDYTLDSTYITICSSDTTIVKVKLYTSVKELLKALKISLASKNIYVNNTLIQSKDFIIDSSVRTITVK